MRLGLEVGKAVPRQVDEVGGDLVALGLAGVEPPLPGQRHHADECLRVEAGQLRVVVAGLELGGEHVLDLGGAVADQRGECAAGRRDRRVADGDAKTVGLLLDVVEQGARRLLEQLARMATDERVGDVVEQPTDLAVDDDGVQTFLAAEVLVDDRFGDAGTLGDLLDAGAVEALAGEQRPADVEQLLATLLARHTDAGRAAAVRPHGGKRDDVVLGHPDSTASFAMRSRDGQRTSRASRSFSRTQMMRAVESSWPLRTPWRAAVGSAWCRLCHDSPIEMIASHQTLVARSRVRNGRSPIVWQIELIDQVVWCSSEMRTRLPQKNAVTAPCQANPLQTKPTS